MKTLMLKYGLFILATLILLMPGSMAQSGQDRVTGAGKPARISKTVPAKGEYPDGGFLVEARKHKIERFKCSLCHGVKSSKGPKDAAIAHGDIKINHGGDVTDFPCFECHFKADRDYLNAEDETKLDLDHSYLLCGQCHSDQQDEWAGSNHGKTVSNRAGERVVKNCTSCHNPHAPALKKQ